MRTGAPDVFLRPATCDGGLRQRWEGAVFARVTIPRQPDDHLGVVGCFVDANPLNRPVK